MRITDFVREFKNRFVNVVFHGQKRTDLNVKFDINTTYNAYKISSNQMSTYSNLQD